jgi:transcriptional regulator with AAA-type ATPase domain
LSEAARDLNRPLPLFPKELNTLLTCYDFPGNIRELRSMVYDAVGSSQSATLSLSTFRAKMGRTATRNGSISSTSHERKTDSGTSESFLRSGFPGILPTLKEATDALVDLALEKASGNQRTAADILGISRQALNKRLLNRSRSGNGE